MPPAVNGGEFPRGYAAFGGASCFFTVCLPSVGRSYLPLTEARVMLLAARIAREEGQRAESHILLRMANTHRRLALALIDGGYAGGYAVAVQLDGEVW